MSRFSTVGVAPPTNLYRHKRMNTQTDQRKQCAHCEKYFLPNSAKHQYCSGGCRTASHRLRKESLVQEQQQQTDQLTVELDALKTAPVTRKKVVQEVNPAWQLFRQKVEAQRNKHNELTDELLVAQEQLDALTNPRKSAYVGAFIGMTLVFLLIAMRYDTRKKQPLGMTYAVLSVLGLLLFGLIGYHTGRYVGQQHNSQDEQTVARIAEIEADCHSYEKQCATARKTLKSLETELNQLPQFLRETIISVDEQRESDSPVG